MMDAGARNGRFVITLGRSLHDIRKRVARQWQARKVWRAMFDANPNTQGQDAG
jgi:hypothetical protein